jgi:DNA-binding beta-propeller fold protein YncE
MKKCVWFAVVAMACSHPKEAPPAAETHGSAVAGSADSAGSAGSATATPRPAHVADATHLPLPGAGSAGVMMDYVIYDDRTKALWVPAGNTAAVDVVDVATDKITQITGFATKEMERNGHKRQVGPSSASLGEPGTVYVGNRGDSSVCAFDEKTFAKGACVTLDAMPDGVTYVAKTKEVWVTTPRDKSLRVLDGKTLVQKAKIALDDEPEGYAVDNKRGRFYTNFEDKDVTLSIDLANHKTLATWPAGCGEDGGHGLRLFEPDGFLVIGCSAQLRAIDVTKGKVVGSVAIGDGVDDLDADLATRTVYAAGSKAGTLAIATLGKDGSLTLVAQPPTAQGARNGAVTEHGKFYVAHGKDGELIIVTH